VCASRKKWQIANKTGVADLQNYLASSILLAATLTFPSVMFGQSGDELKPAQSQSLKDQEANSARNLSGTWGARAPVGDARKSVYGDEDGGWWNYALRGEDLSMTPWAEAKFKANRPSFGPNREENSNDLAYGCFPRGVPRVYASIAAGMQIIEQPGRTLMLFGQNVRQIYTDGRGHPKDLHPQWMGHSIGSWQGDTFVVDTIGIDDRTWIDRMGHPHSDALHLVERFRRTADNTLELEMAVDDPKAYTAPWTARKVFQLRPSSVRAGEGTCEDIFLNEAFGLKPMLPSR
jgi:hypothetical protein